MKIDVLVCGIGGQGIITLGMVIGEVCAQRNVKVVTAETHGMAQRMGSVEIFVRIGNVEAPLIPMASADYLVALEMIEALRAIKYLKKCGWLLLSNLYIPPPGAENVPSKKTIIEALSKLPINIVIVDVESIVNKLRDSRVVNMVMLGALLAFDNVAKVIPVDVAEDTVQHMLGYVNREAVMMGYNHVKTKIINNDVYKSKDCS